MSSTSRPPRPRGFVRSDRVLVSRGAGGAAAGRILRAPAPGEPYYRVACDDGTSLSGLAESELRAAPRYAVHQRVCVDFGDRPYGGTGAPRAPCPHAAAQPPPAAVACTRQTEGTCRARPSAAHSRARPPAVARARPSAPQWRARAARRARRRARSSTRSNSTTASVSMTSARASSAGSSTPTRARRPARARCSAGAPRSMSRARSTTAAGCASGGTPTRALTAPSTSAPSCWMMRARGPPPPRTVAAAAAPAHAPTPWACAPVGAPDRRG